MDQRGLEPVVRQSIREAGRLKRRAADVQTRDEADDPSRFRHRASLYPIITLLVIAALGAIACGASPLTPNEADKLLEAQIDTTALGPDAAVPSLVGLGEMTYRDLAADAAGGRLLSARLIRQIAVSEEAIDVTGAYDGVMSNCLTRVQLDVSTPDGVTLGGRYRLSRRSDCSARYRAPEQAGAVAGSRLDVHRWTVRFTPPLPGPLSESAVTAGADTTGNVHLDGAFPGSAAYLSLFSAGGAGRMTIAKYRYLAEPPLARALGPAGKVRLGRYAVDTVTEVTIAADGSSAQAAFNWHVSFNEVGSLISPVRRLHGSGTAQFRRAGRSWTVGDIRFGEPTRAE